MLIRLKTFLHQVVLNTLDLNLAIDRIVFVLPTQRSGVYLKRILQQELRQATFLPKIITFDNLVETISEQKKTNSIELLFDFYEIHKLIISKEKLEPFETFITWAKIVLDDFNEIDNNLITVENIFSTLKNIQNIQHLLSEDDLQNRYFDFIEKIDQYYFKFNEYLKNHNKNYQGMLYRNVISELEHFKKHTEQFYVFIGFAHLKKAEEVIIEELILEKKAQVFWDISDAFYKDTSNNNSCFHRYFSQWNHYRAQPYRDFYSDHFDKDTIQIIGVSKKVGMVKYIAQLLQNEENVNEVTVLLNDQNIIPSVLQSLPDNVDKVNITMGIPVNHFPITDLIKSILDLHVDHSNQSKGFYYKNVLKVLKNPIFTNEEYSLQHIIDKIIASNSLFFTVADLKKIFNTETSDFSNSLLALFNDYSNDNHVKLLEAINQFIILLKSKYNWIENEILYRNYTIIQTVLRMVSRYNAISDLKSIRLVLQRLIHTENLYFYGEPLQGLQLMGFLESQVLDFQKVYILSVNENILPKNKVTETFIPFDVRKHYGLPTYQDAEMVDKYLFYRLLDKSKQVTILYNSDLDSFGKGEKSRFVEQLLWRFPDIKHTFIEPINTFDNIQNKNIDKTDETILIIKNLLQSGVSPSALTSYIYNPIDFYKQKVLNIKETAEIEEIVAENTLGTVVHAVLERIYTPFIGGFIDFEMLREASKKIRVFTVEAFLKELKNPNINEGKNKLIYEVAVNFVKRFIENEIIEIKNGNTIKILGLEQKISSEFRFNSFDFPIKFKGIIDRIDTYNGTIRIIDYKTGAVTPTQLKAAHFDDKIMDYKFSKVLQVLLYSCIYSAENKIDNKTLNAGIISFKKHKNGFMPVNFSEKSKETDFEITRERQQLFLNEIELLLQEILDIDAPFVEKAN